MEWYGWLALGLLLGWASFGVGLWMWYTSDFDPDGIKEYKRRKRQVKRSEAFR